MNLNEDSENLCRLLDANPFGIVGSFAHSGVNSDWGRVLVHRLGVKKCCAPLTLRRWWSRKGEAGGSPWCRPPQTALALSQAPALRRDVGRPPGHLFTLILAAAGSELRLGRRHFVTRGVQAPPPAILSDPRVWGYGQRVSVTLCCSTFHPQLSCNHLSHVLLPTTASLVQGSQSPPGPGMREAGPGRHTETPPALGSRLSTSSQQPGLELAQLLCRHEPLSPGSGRRSEASSALPPGSRFGGSWSCSKPGA